MFIVPLPGDKIETAGGVARTVLSYGNYRESPAVYVQGDGDDTITVPLSEIVSVNGTPVKGTKILTSTGHVKRKIQLPQKDDVVKAGGKRIKVKSLKLSEYGKYSEGLLVVGITDEKEDATIRAADIESIVRADGSTDFSRRAFLSTYKDYLGSQV